MYLINKYSICYNNIINRAKARVLVEYSEVHHIIPKSIGGTNNKENLVRLTAREHFICHLLLIRMVQGKAKYQMQKAISMMTVRNKFQKRYRITSRQFEKIKKESSIAMSILTKGKPKHSPESKKKLSDKAKGRLSPFKGKQQPESAKKLLSSHRSKPCISPLGERFASTKEAGIAYNISGVAIRGNIQRGLSGWRYEREEDQSIVELNKVPKKIKPKIKQSPEHIANRVAARKANGHYKDREATLVKMSVAAKLKSK